MKIGTVLVNLMLSLALLSGAVREEVEKCVWMFVRERYALYVTGLYCVMLQTFSY